MLNITVTLLGKLFSKTAKTLNLGNGSTWPGHIALKLNKHFISQTIKNSGLKTIIVAGTNGKTTTTKLIGAILEADGKHILHNVSGANLSNGIASSLILQSSLTGQLTKDYAIFEVDENALPLVLKEVTPDYVVLLNLFRDQLDRYGEVNSIADNWKKALKHLPKTSTLILNADDPVIAYLGDGIDAKNIYFSVVPKRHEKSIAEHAVDSLYCPQCGEKLHYKSITFSHLGDWSCTACKLTRPQPSVTSSPHYPLSGLYNYYNTHAAIALTNSLKISEENRLKALKNFTPAFGRQEHIVLNGHQIQLFLSKNPTGFNESLRTIKEQGGEHIMFVLNDRIADGKDVSWIWDTDIENLLSGDESITISGDRVYDMALRLKYAKKQFEILNLKFEINESLNDAINKTLDKLPKTETLYILPTYTAMLEVRKVLTGRKIL